MQDGATPHTARVSMDFLATAAIDVLLWPAKSPDINIIENIWSIMSRNINGMNPVPKTAAAIRRLVVSVPRRLRAIVDARGGHVNY